MGTACNSKSDLDPVCQDLRSISGLTTLCNGFLHPWATPRTNLSGVKRFFSSTLPALAASPTALVGPGIFRAEKGSCFSDGFRFDGDGLPSNCYRGFYRGHCALYMVVCASEANYWLQLSQRVSSNYFLRVLHQSQLLSGQVLIITENIDYSLRNWIDRNRSSLFCTEKDSYKLVSPEHQKRIRSIISAMYFFLKYHLRSHGNLSVDTVFFGQGIFKAANPIEEGVSDVDGFQGILTYMFPDGLPVEIQSLVDHLEWEERSLSLAYHHPALKIARRRIDFITSIYLKHFEGKGVVKQQNEQDMINYWNANYANTPNAYVDWCTSVDAKGSPLSQLNEWVFVPNPKRPDKMPKYENGCPHKFFYAARHFFEHKGLEYSFEELDELVFRHYDNFIALFTPFVRDVLKDVDEPFDDFDV